MGAYSNPEMLIDTQSGQHWRNLQEKISNTTSKIFEAQASVVKQNEKFAEEARENVKNARTLTNRLNIKNPKLDLNTAVEPLISKYDVLQNDIALGRGTDVPGARATCQTIEESITGTAEMFVDLDQIATNYREKTINLGRVGGFSQYNNPTDMKVSSILSDNSKGSIKARYDEKTYEPMVDIYEKDNSKPIVSLTRTKLKELLDNNGGLKTVPSATDILDGLRKNPTIFDNKGNLLSDYILPEERVVKEINKSTITNKKEDSNTSIVTKSSFLTPNAELISSNLEQNVNAAVEGLISTGDAVTFYKHYVEPDSKDVTNLNGELNAEQIAKTRQWISDSFIKSLPTIEDKDASQKVEQITKITEDTSKGKDGSGRKGNTTRQKTDKEILNENLNKNYDKDNGFFTGKGAYVSVIKGKMYKVTKEGDLIDEKPLDLKAARIYLGLPENGILTVNK